MDLRELLIADPHRARLERQTERAFGHEAEDLSKDLIEYRDPPKRLESGLVGRVLPGVRRDIG